MTTEKIQQHFIPKFYLRNFSFKGNGKQIGVFNDINGFFVPCGKIKTQACKPFYYGRDGRIENGLATIESEVAPIIVDIRERNLIPSFSKDTHVRLLHFVILMSARNPTASEEVIESGNQLRQMIHEMTNGKAEIGPEAMLKKDEAVRMLLQQLTMSVTFCMDLKMKLLLNKTSSPFITSDNPVIKYNQFLEQRKWPGGNTGYGNIGLQMFFPVDPFKMLLFYDDSIYKAGDKKKQIIELTNPSDVEQLNLLQFLNSKSIIFFNDIVDRQYLVGLSAQAKKYQKANINQTQLYPLIINSPEGEIKDRVIHQTTTDCKINLKIENMSLTKKAKHHVLSKSAAQLRPKASELMKVFFDDEIKKYLLTEMAGMR